MLRDRDRIVGRGLGIRSADQSFGLVEKSELIGTGLFRTGAEPLVCRKSQLLLEPFDLQVLQADDGLERTDIIGQFR